MNFIKQKIFLTKLGKIVENFDKVEVDLNELRKYGQKKFPSIFTSHTISQFTEIDDALRNKQNGF